MSTTETSAPVPTAPERITIVLKAQEGSTLEQICQFVSFGMPVAIGRGMAVIAGVSDEDLFQILGQERDERWMQAKLQEEALGAPAHLAAHAQEMLDLLHRINVKVGGLNAVVGHGGEPSDQMWEEHDEAMDAIWDLLAKVKSAASVDKGHVNQIAKECENVNQTTDIPVVAQSPYSEVRVKNIDEWIKTLENAKRYEWLRDSCGVVEYKAIAGSIGPGMLPSGEDLDSSIDQQIKAQENRLREVEPCVD